MAQVSPTELPPASPPESRELRRASIEALDEAIVRLAARMNAACYEQLVLIREFDEQLGWLEWQLGNCSEWLAWRCDISLGTAREKVRVAHALAHVPNISQAFAEGRLSYSKVRALTRVTHLRHEGDLLRFALKHTAIQVEERCRELRCGTVASTMEANRAHERRFLSLRRDAARGSVVLTLEVPLEEGEVIERALEVARERMITGDAEQSSESWSAHQADAFVAVARSYLDGGDDQKPRSPNHLITVHVDRSALVDGRGRSALPVETVRRLACDAETVTLIEDEDERPLSVGRQSRIVPKRLLKALWARDRGCTFPGCNRKRFVDAHHVQHWANGGETSLDNLLLLCTRHHRAVHEGGYSIRRDFQDAWRFFRPDGIGVPPCGYVVRLAEANYNVDTDAGDRQPGMKLARLIRAAMQPSAMGFAPRWKEPFGGVAAPAASPVTAASDRRN
ncbi:MAG TPA: DUF222 domain-containing protein [Woeseiaceae bacterium]|nr:DUF222 domain-containing protein [Woeseiaceae bacterium]